MELKKGYKQTELGMIPSDWVVKKLGDIAVIKRGKFTPRPRNNPIYYNGDIPFVQTGDVTKSQGKINQYNQTLNKEGLAVSSLFRKGTILMTIAANIGYSGVLEFDMACPDSLVAIDGIDNIDNNYLNFYFSFNRSKIEELATTGAQMNLNIERLSPFKVILPSNKNEQTAIADTLSDADDLINTLEKLIEKKRKIKQGAMQKLLKPKKDWKIKKLGDICTTITTGKLDANEMSQDGEYRFYTCAKSYYYIDTFAFDDEALLVSGNGENVGYVHYYNGKFNAYQRTYVLLGFKESIQYVKLFLDQFLSLRISQEANNGNTPYIKMGTLSDMEIGLPDSIVEQNKIAEILSDLQLEIIFLEKKLSKTKLIKKGMMQNLLTGKIRLI